MTDKDFKELFPDCRQVGVECVVDYEGLNIRFNDHFTFHYTCKGEEKEANFQSHLELTDTASKKIIKYYTEEEIPRDTFDTLLKFIGREDIIVGLEYDEMIYAQNKFLQDNAEERRCTHDQNLSDVCGRTARYIQDLKQKRLEEMCKVRKGRK